MKMLLGISTALLLMTATTSVPANARGCLRGAAVGGIAGHYAGRHGFIGAAIGCWAGRRQARLRMIEENRARMRANSGYQGRGQGYPNR
jgi:hypothetical protein